MDDAGLSTRPLRHGVVMVCYLLAACGSSKTLDDIPNKTGIDRTTEQTVEQTYRNVVGAMRRCYSKPAFRVEADYFTEAKSASLRLIWSPGSGLLRELIRLQIDSAPTGATLKAQYVSAEPRFEQAVDAWVRGDSNNCPLA